MHGHNSAASIGRWYGGIVRSEQDLTASVVVALRFLRASLNGKPPSAATCCWAKLPTRHRSLATVPPMRDPRIVSLRTITFKFVHSCLFPVCERVYLSEPFFLQPRLVAVGAASDEGASSGPRFATRTIDTYSWADGKTVK